jgi:predicted glycoside hydrolase/deacetylase ChbG (UPF0249 family)
MSAGERNLVVNADDLGLSAGVNAGVLHCHVHGVVTSASLMVTGPAAREAVALAAEHRGLALGLHWDLDSGLAGDPVDTSDPAAVRGELERQLEAFHEVVGRAPTHVDSHHHVHREPPVARIAAELVEPLGVPLREESGVTYVGGFYGQWEWQVTDLEHIRPEFLIWILRHEVAEGWTEIGCHPAFVTGDFESVYRDEREVEVATLTDPRVRREIEALGIRLASYADLASPER